MSDSTRDELLAELFQVGRAHSDTTVLTFSAIAEQMGLSASDVKALGILQQSGPLPAGELAKAVGLTPASVTTLVDRLEQGGFVQRTRDPDDRRKVIIQICPEKLKEAQVIFEPVRRSVAELFARFSDDELTTILDFLTHDVARMKKLMSSFDDRS